MIDIMAVIDGDIPTVSFSAKYNLYTVYYSIPIYLLIFIFRIFCVLIFFVTTAVCCCMHYIWDILHIYGTIHKWKYIRSYVRNKIKIPSIFPSPPVTAGTTVLVLLLATTVL